MLNEKDIRELFASIDAKDAKTFASFISEEGRFIYGAQMDVSGRKAVEQAVASFFSSLDSLSHTNLKWWSADDGQTQFVYGDVHYVLPNGNTADIPFLNRFDFDGEKISLYHVFTDPTPMFQAAQG